jgi:hypothetical protein
VWSAQASQSFVVGCIIFLYTKIFVFLSKLACCARAHEIYVHMWYSYACELCGGLYHFSLYENICLFYKTSLLACIFFPIGGGDNSILWLSFAQQKPDQSFNVL